jgi:hypothetical protein
MAKSGSLCYGSWDLPDRVVCSVPNHRRQSQVLRVFLAFSVVTLLLLSQQPAQAGSLASQLAAVAASANLSAPAYFPVFTPESRWNTPLAGDAAVDPNSGVYIGTLDWAIERHGSLAINLDEYTVPIWYADSSTPRYKVWCTAGWGCGPGFGDDVPIPDEAQFDPSGDGHMVVIDVERQLSYEFWRAWRGNSGWYAGFGIVFNTQADPAGGSAYLGVLDPVGHQFGAWAPSARASGVSLLGGLIRYGELAAGRIDHALAFSFPYTRGDAYALPMATHSDNVHTPDRMAPHNLPLGAQLRLRPDVDVDERCWGNPTCITIGRALQEYGMYLVDTSYRTTMYAEGLYGKDVSWEGLLGPRDATVFGAYDFEVLALPELTSAP